MLRYTFLGLAIEFLNTHPKKKEIVAEFNNEHHINESDLKTLEEGKDLADRINDINLIQQKEESEELNIRKILAKSVKPSSQIKESEITQVNIFDVVK